MTSRIPDHQQQTAGKVPRERLTKKQVGLSEDDVYFIGVKV